VSDAIEGPAFGWPARTVAVSALCAVVWQVLEAWPTFQEQPDRVTLTLLGLAGLGLLYGLGHIVMTRTRVDATHIRQLGWSHTEVEIARITQIKLIYIPYLSWLVSPRLVVRAGGMRTWVFHAADRALLQGGEQAHRPLP